MTPPTWPPATTDLHERILRYLARRGSGGADAGEIRYGAGLCQTSPGAFWGALRELTDRGLVLAAQGTQRKLWAGFEETRTFPLFAVIEAPKGGPS